MLLVKIVRSTGEGHLWYGICVPCSKRLPGVRDAFSEAFGVKNRLLRYGRDIRCQKQPSGVRDAFSKSRRTADPQTVDSLLGYATHFQRRTVPKAVLRQISCCQVKQVWKILIQRSRSEARPYILLLIYFILLFRPSISPLLIEYFMAFLMGEMSRWTLFTKLTTSP